MKKLLFILTLACGLMAAQAQNATLRKSVEDGIKTSIQQTENREWSEAFATCRALDGMIAVEEQKTKKPAPELHNLVTKERLRMYMRLSNKQKDCQEQLAKLEDILTIKELKPDESVYRELILIKVKVTPQERQSVMSVADIFRAKIIDVAPESLIIELTGNQQKIDAFISLLDGYEILEQARTGIAGLGRGTDHISYRE